MKRITKEELNEFLRKHKLWLDNKEGGERANLYGANLCGADLREADLCGANLRGANLYGADLYGADLCGANLRGANLCGDDLREADLCGANLRGANLYGANLREADLCGADLREADLCGANLRGANLCGANLRGADLRGANLYGANLPIACPEKGAFIGWKKASGFIVELLITEDARRCSATTRKCRCDKAVVLSITNPDGSDAGMDYVPSSYRRSFIYTIGETVEEPKFNPDRWNECSEGIHFFITRDEAVQW